MNTYLALDVGSSSSRAMLIQEHQGRFFPDANAVVRRSYRFDTAEPGQATIDPQALRTLVEACIDELLRGASVESIQGVGMATFAGNLVGLGAANQPLTPLVTYADTRNRAGIARFGATMDPVELLQRTGTRLHPAYAPLQLDRLAQTDIWPDVVLWCDFATYCYRVWFGRAVPMSYSLASWSGMLHRETLSWDDEWLRLLSLSPAHFPDLADVDAAQAGLCDEYAQRWPALRATPFALALADGAAAQIGSGATAPGTATLTMGTTSAIRQVRTEALPAVPLGCWGYRITAQQHLLGGALSEGGNIFAWAQDHLRVETEDIARELSGREPGQHGLIALPLLNGERSPGWASHASGTLHGLRINTTALDLLHALLESVAIRLALIAEQLDLSDDVQLMASGGALDASDVWGQMIADALGLSLHVLANPETTALGVACVARAVGEGSAIELLEPAIAEIISPDLTKTEVYRTLRERQQALYRVLYTEPEQN